MATRTSQTKRSQRGGKVKVPVVKEVVVRAPVPIRMTPELIDRIDAVRPDLIPREPFVRHLVDIALSQLEEEG